MPVLTHKIQVLLDDDQYGALLALAKAKGKSVSAFLRDAVVERLLADARRVARQGDHGDGTPRRRLARHGGRDRAGPGGTAEAVMKHFLDTNIFMYAAGRPHPFKAPSVAVLRRVAQEELEGVTNAEVLQEILYRYTAIGESERGLHLARLAVAQVRRLPQGRWGCSCDPLRCEDAA